MSEILTATVPVEMARQRLDAVLVELFPDYSRSRLQQWIKDGRVLINGAVPRAKDKVEGFETIELQVVPEIHDASVQPQDIALDVVYVDDDIIVINKSVDLVVHPAAGHADGTMQNALLHFDASLAEVPRAGIVHRLDKDTTGLLVVARNIKAHKLLVEQLQAREFAREYQAVVRGVMTAGGTIDEPIGRDPRDRKRMAVRFDGKPSVTHYRVIQRFGHHTHVRVQLETGRTHQIRVHLTHIHYPIIGDPVYGGRLQLPRAASDLLKTTLRGFKRQALHAAKLGLEHPVTGEYLEWETPLPEDMQQLIRVLASEDLA
ncbi:MAG: 23S rRNA pseudouridine(1911/1915/1917) synthase RluD [Gammaproteobacteria bacterium]|nr:23S rRNA pseudouridine(1911/1915/1917) synthase RluD [Gammaproteobacteria bacterium]